MPQPSSNETSCKLRRTLLIRIRLTILFFMAALALSGITAFPLTAEVQLLNHGLGKGTVVGDQFPELANWLKKIETGLEYNDRNFPFIAYGTDWLAFAHLVIAIAFIGPFRDPIRNVWVIHFGMICCVLIFPLALFCGALRGIPLGWQLIDCSFGLFGLIPLWLILRWIRQLEQIQTKS